jgi:hypothetical protein
LLSFAFGSFLRPEAVVAETEETETGAVIEAMEAPAV